MEMRFSALLFSQNTEQGNSNLNQGGFFSKIQDMNIKSSYLGLEDPSNGLKSTIDLLLNTHTQILSFKQDARLSKKSFVGTSRPNKARSARQEVDL